VGAVPVVGVVPARYNSRRWPGKVLAQVKGRPLLAWAWESLVGAPEVTRAVVAIDDERIARWCESAGAPFVMTSPTCRNGTERVAEVAEQYSADLYVNVQADQVGVEPRIISRLIGELRAHPEWPMATLGTRAGVAESQRSPDQVLVLSGPDGAARWFRRGSATAPHDAAAVRHIGVYGYRREALAAYRQAEPSPEELSEHLEQLRALALGWKVGVVRVRSRARSYDRPEDARRGLEF